MRTVSVLILLVPLLAACSLVDQSTFAPTSEAPPPPEPAPRPTPGLDPRQPLVTVDYGAKPPEYQQLLAYAVHAAEARSRTVQYDVISVVKTPEDAAAGTERGSEVLRAIMGEKVPANRLHLGLRVDPAAASSQVRVYVR